MHVELATLEFLNDFCLIIEVPVLFCVLFEVNREGRVNHRTGQLLGTQSLEALLHEFIDDVLVRFAVGIDIFQGQMLFLLLKQVLSVLFFQIGWQILILS